MLNFRNEIRIYLSKYLFIYVWNNKEWKLKDLINHAAYDNILYWSKHGKREIKYLNCCGVAAYIEKLL